jgi:hypothetical protein
MNFIISYRVSKGGMLVKSGKFKVKKAANEFVAKAAFGKMMEKKHPGCHLQITGCIQDFGIEDFFNGIFK